MLEFLLCPSADVNVADELKKAPTHYVVEIAQPRMLVKLLQRAAKIQVEDEDHRVSPCSNHVQKQSI